MKHRGLAATALALALAGLAPPALASQVCGDPPDTGVWIWVDGVERLANDVALARFYPDRAKRQELNGEATLRCEDDQCMALDQAIERRECQGPDCLERDGWVPDYRFAAAAERAARELGLLPTTKPAIIKVAFRVTGPGRGRQWPCGEAPPP